MTAPEEAAAADATAAPISLEPVHSTAIVTNMADPRGLAGDFPAFATAAEVMAVTGGNTGNVAFVEAIQKLIGGQSRHLGLELPAAGLLDQVEAVVICCANQVGAHCDIGCLVPLLEAWDKPLVLIGLGAQASSAREMPEVPEGTVTFLRACSERRPTAAANISVRGEFSRQCLANLGIESVVTGCPSGLLSPDACLGTGIATRVQQLRDAAVKLKLAIAAGNPWDAGNMDLELRLLRLADEFDGDYIIQHPENLLKVMMDPEQAPLDDVGQVLLDRYAPSFGEATAARRWLRRHGAVHINTGSWMAYLRRCDGVLGMRFHGVALGVQAGIPGLVITIDSRTEELAEQAGIPWIAAEQASQLNQEELVERVLWSPELAERFDRARAGNATAMAAFLQANRLPLSGHLRALLAGMGLPEPGADTLSC